MHFVCHSEAHGQRWMYNPEDRTYYRVSDSTVTGKIKGDSLPDPDALRMTYKEKGKSRTEPAQSVKRLYEHWRKNA